MKSSPMARACSQAALYRSPSDRSSQNLIARHKPSHGPGVRFYNRIAAETHAMLNGSPLVEMLDENGRTYWLLPASYHTRKRAPKATRNPATPNKRVELAAVYTLHTSNAFDTSRIR